ncbi:male sterility protein-domain-containing protein [Fusarium venenatum]|uniref:male sterility protein-domain-containing protein n=1 Tax=Fusarium venenatum TaxID=56646 RepID=UPI001DAB420B|nr:male sterility protein-domain-containing protein [Fusarium venenatum]
MKALRQTLPLPPYMRPSLFQILPDIPRTAHLKIDRKAIQDIPVQIAQSEISQSLTDSEQRLSELWRRVLPLDPGSLTHESDFFLIGGNSILLVKLQALLRHLSWTAPKLVTLMGSSTLGAMASVLEDCGPVNIINWDVETNFPHNLQLATPLRVAGKTTDINVLLTGASGYLGRHLLSSLIKDHRVARVHCLCRTLNNDKMVDDPDSKVKITQSDLTEHNLGIPKSKFSQLATEVDVIIHCAANRSFWDRYEALKADNLDSTKELVKFVVSSGRAIPLHFMSSGAVVKYSNGLTPPADGGDGYVATKWASEAFLKQAVNSIGLPVFSHRPVECESVHQSEEEDMSIVNELMQIVKLLECRPSFDGVGGFVDVMPVSEVVEAIHEAALNSQAGEGLCILEHKAHQRAYVESFATVVESDDSLSKLPSIPILEWFGRAKKAGFSYFLASQDLVLGSQLFSRR